MWDVARYSVAEALIVYPALEEHMDHGQIIADKDRNQNKQVSSQATKRRLFVGFFFI